MQRLSSRSLHVLASPTCVDSLVDGFALQVDDCIAKFS